MCLQQEQNNANEKLWETQHMKTKGFNYWFCLNPNARGVWRFTYFLCFFRLAPAGILVGWLTAWLSKAIWASLESPKTQINPAN